MLPVVAECAHLGVEHLVALRLGDVVFVVRHEGQQVGAGGLGRSLDVAAVRVTQQLLHLRQLAPAGAERALVVAAQGAFEHGLDAAFDVLGELDQVGSFLQLDQSLHYHVDRVPAERREGACRVERHDGLDARGDLGGLLPVEGEVQPHARFGECRVELEERVGLAPVFACALRHALEPTAVFGVDDDDHVAAPHRLGDQAGQCHALAGLGGAHQQRAALEILQRPVQRRLARLHAVDVRQADLGVGLGLGVIAQERQQARGDRELAVVHLGQFIQALRVHGAPLEPEAKEYLVWVAAPARQVTGAEQLNATAGQ